MELAITAYQTGTGLNECAKVYNIPKATLCRHAANRNKIANGAFKRMGKSTTLPANVEEELVSHILKLEEALFSLTTCDIRKLAYDITEKNGITNVFNREKKIAGKRWFYGFMRRHSNLKLRRPESTVFNHKNMDNFLDLLERLYVENALDATRVYNVAQRQFSAVQKKPRKIIGQRGKQHVDNDHHQVETTMVCCANADGQFIAPMIIFKSERKSPELSLGAPSGSLIEISETGRINSDLFKKWLKHFIETAKPNKERNILLLLDGPSCHCKHLEALLLAREHGVILLQLPGHTTHRLQPLDVAFFKPMKTFYTQATEKWLNCNPAVEVTELQVVRLLAEAYEKARELKIENGFRTVGICPVDRRVFEEHHFVPSDNLKRTYPQPQCVYGKKTNETEVCDPLAVQPVEILKRKLVDCDDNSVVPQSTSKSPKLDLSLEEILPVPISMENTQLSMETQAPELTSSPYKEDLVLSKKRRKKSI